MSYLYYTQRNTITSRVLKAPARIHFCRSGLTCIAQFLNTLGCLYSCTHNIMRQGKSPLFFLVFQVFSVVSLFLSFYLNFAILILKRSWRVNRSFVMGKKRQMNNKLHIMQASVAFLPLNQINLEWQLFSEKKETPRKKSATWNYFNWLRS